MSIGVVCERVGCRAKLSTSEFLSCRGSRSQGMSELNGTLSMRTSVSIPSGNVPFWYWSETYMVSTPILQSKGWLKDSSFGCSSKISSMERCPWKRGPDKHSSALSKVCRRLTWLPSRFIVYCRSVWSPFIIGGVDSFCRLAFDNHNV